MTEIKKIIAVVVLVIVAIIVIFQFVGTTAPEMVSSSESITDANSCSSNLGTNNESLTYNGTTKLCDNSSDMGVAEHSDVLPLSTLFSSSGIIWLVVMAMLLIAMVVFIFKRGTIKNG